MLPRHRKNFVDTIIKAKQSLQSGYQCTEQSRYFEQRPQTHESQSIKELVWFLVRLVRWLIILLVTRSIAQHKLTPDRKCKCDQRVEQKIEPVRNKLPIDNANDHPVPHREDAQLHDRRLLAGSSTIRDVAHGVAEELLLHLGVLACIPVADFERLATVPCVFEPVVFPCWNCDGVAGL